MALSQIVSSEDCARIFECLRGGFTRAGIRLGQRALLDLEDLLWLTEHRGPIFGEGGAATQDSGRAMSGLADALLLQRAAAALCVAAGLNGFQTEARKLRHWRPHPSTEAEVEAADIMYQMEVAAMARLGLPFPVTIAEPDLRIGDLSIACKQPRRPQALPEAVMNGITQVLGQTARGIVAISLQHVINTIVEGSATEFRNLANDRFKATIRPHLNSLYSRLDRSPPLLIGEEAPTGVLGVIFTARFLHLEVSTSRAGFVLSVFPLWGRRADQGAALTLTTIALGLREGENRLLGTNHIARPSH